MFSSPIQFTLVTPFRDIFRITWPKSRLVLSIWLSSKLYDFSTNFLQKDLFAYTPVISDFQERIPHAYRCTPIVLWYTTSLSTYQKKLLFLYQASTKHGNRAIGIKQSILIANQYKTTWNNPGLFTDSIFVLNFETQAPIRLHVKKKY